jgi:tight adherence protein C
MKVLVPVALCIAVLCSGLASESPFIVYAAALGVGYLAPDFWMGRKIAARQTRIRLGLPDMLDLLIICIEAGLGLDQAMARAAQELSSAQPAISDEFGVVVLEQRAGRPRSDAWRHLAERTDVVTVRTLVPWWCNRKSLERASPRFYALIPRHSEPSAFRQWRNRRRRPP